MCNPVHDNLFKTFFRNNLHQLFIKVSRDCQSVGYFCHIYKCEVVEPIPLPLDRGGELAFAL